MRGLFSKRNDYGDPPDSALVTELAHWGIQSRGDFTLIMKRHRRTLVRIDRQRLTKWEVEFFSREFGESFVKDAVQRRYWYAYPALVRTALELQYGDRAAVREQAPNPSIERTSCQPLRVGQAAAHVNR